MNSTEFFGTKAGRVWAALKAGDKTLTQLQNATGMTAKEVSMGLGWLAREGKIAIKNTEGLYQKFSLTDRM
jgi:DNA-binding transcriptional regulator GbsR (MarR family)